MSLCGTMAGTRAHRKRKEPLCEACLTVQRETRRDLYHRAAKHRRKCPQGHVLSDENVWIYPSGRRVCRICYPQQCGTRAGYERHIRHREPACEPCLAAHRVHARQYNPKRNRTKAAQCRQGHDLSDRYVNTAGRRYCPICKEERRGRFDPAKCGTTAGEAAHRRYGVPTCEPCRQAATRYEQSRRRTRAKPTEERPALRIPAFLIEMYEGEEELSDLAG